jgi:hypothetical protein
MMHAVFGWFDSSADVKAAVSSLKEEGFSERAISVRDFEPITQENGEGNSEAPSRIMVAVHAEGKAAAKAWSVLQDVRTRTSKSS